MFINKLVSSLYVPKFMVKKLYCVILILTLFVISGFSSVCLAQQSANIKLPQLDDSLTKGLVLKNVHAYRDIFFTKPQTWKVLPGTKLVLTFNHSTELLPDRSYINVFINGKLIKKEPLDKSSVETKTIAIPMPLNLGDYNTLKLEVEQHYTDTCEDPLDHGLWTKIHPDTHIAFNYSIVQPKVDLAKYPFPLYDPFAYETTTINYIIPDVEPGTTDSVNALGIIAADIAQKVAWHKLKYIASPANKAIDNSKNTVIVGTPSENPNILKLNAAIGGSIKKVNGAPVFTDKEGRPLANNIGLIYFINNPQNKNRAILIVSGNGQEGVKLAARYLANETLAKDLKGNHKLVDSYRPKKDNPSTIAEYVHNQSMSFEDLGYEDRKATRIAPPPLVYYIRVMPDMNTSKSMLSFDLKYSYGPRLNDELSTLELIFNDISLKSVRLDNPKGEKNQTLKVDVPAQYVKPYNEVKIVYHLFPVKFGYCENWYDDDLYGIIHKNSMVNLPSDAKVVFPDLGLLNDALYPYSTLQDLSNTLIVMPEDPDLHDYQAMLNTIGAIAKVTDSDAGIDLAIADSQNASNSELSDRNIILIGLSKTNSLINKIKEKLYLTFDGNYKELKPVKDQNAYLAYYDDQGVLEQIISSYNPSKVTTVMHGKTNKAVENASTALSEKEKLITINDGNFFTVDDRLIEKVIIPEKRQRTKPVSAKKTSRLSKLWPPTDIWGWACTIALCFLILFVVVIVLNILGSIIFGRKGN